MVGFMISHPSTGPVVYSKSAGFAPGSFDQSTVISRLPFGFFTWPFTMRLTTLLRTRKPSIVSTSGPWPTTVE